MPRLTALPLLPMLVASTAWDQKDGHPEAVHGENPVKMPGKTTGEVRLLGLWRVPFFYGWLLAGVCFLNEFVASGNGGLTISLFYAPIHDSLGWSLTMFTAAATFSSVAGLVVLPFVGPMMDRLGPRPFMLYGAIAGGLGLILLSRMTQPWHFWVLYCFVGALGLNELGSFASPIIISKWFIRHRGRAMAIATNGTIIGGLVMTPILGLLITHYGWRSTWAIMGTGILVLMVPLVILFVRRRPEDMGLLPDGDEPGEGESAPEASKRRRTALQEESWTFKEAVKTRTLWILIAAFNLQSFVSAVQTFHSVTFLTRQLGLSVAAASLVLSMRLAGVPVVRIFWGFIVEKVPVRYCMAFCFTVKSTSLLWLIILPFPYNIGLMLVTVWIGGSQGLLQPIAMANYYGRASQGAIQGMMRPFLAVPSLVGPLLVAILFDKLGNFNIAFVVASVLGMASGLVVLFAKPPKKPARPLLPEAVAPAM